MRNENYIGCIYRILLCYNSGGRIGYMTYKSIVRGGGREGGEIIWVWVLE
jgi:hypothetical protein